MQECFVIIKSSTVPPYLFNQFTNHWVIEIFNVSPLDTLQSKREMQHELTLFRSLCKKRWPFCMINHYNQQLTKFLKKFVSEKREEIVTAFYTSANAIIQLRRKAEIRVEREIITALLKNAQNVQNLKGDKYRYFYPFFQPGRLGNFINFDVLFPASALEFLFYALKIKLSLQVCL